MPIIYDLRYHLITLTRSSKKTVNMNILSRASILSETRFFQMIRIRAIFDVALLSWHQQRMIMKPDRINNKIYIVKDKRDDNNKRRRKKKKKIRNKKEMCLGRWLSGYVRVEIFTICSSSRTTIITNCGLVKF